MNAMIIHADYRFAPSSGTSIYYYIIRDTRKVLFFVEAKKWGIYKITDCPA
jgi:hypothetical protein